MYINLKEFSRIKEIKATTLLSYRKRGLLPEPYIIAGNKCYLYSDVIAWCRPKKNKPGPKGKDNA